MIDILSSPILFPSDMESSKLTADPNFKLPEPINWTDHDYHNTMMDMSMTTLTDLIKLEPVNENDIHVYSPFVNTVLSPKVTSVLNQKTTEDDYTQRLALLDLAQSLVYAYTLPIHPPPDGTHKKNGDMTDGQKALWNNLRGALDMVEDDLQRKGQDSFYSSSQQQITHSNHSVYYQQNIGDDWSWYEDLTDVPDLVHSIGDSSLSLHSVVENHQPSTSTPVLLENDTSSHFDDSKSFQSIEPSGTKLSTLSQQMENKKANETFKNWVIKVKKTTSSMKQDCVKSVSSASRKFCQWIKN